MIIVFIANYDRRLQKCFLSLKLVNSRYFSKKNEFYFRYLWPKLVVVFGKVTKGKQVDLCLGRNMPLQKVRMLTRDLIAGSEEYDVICIT